MDLTADFEAYQQHITSSLVNVTRTASQISNQDLSFHRSSSEKFSSSLEGRSSHLLRLTNKLLKATVKDSAIKTHTLKKKDDIEDNWRKIVDVIDDLLEKADASLDEFTGVLRRMSPAVPDVTESPHKRSKPANGVDNLAQAKVSRPQEHFLHKVDNYETGPWKPLLKTKPHAIKSLAESIGPDENGYKHPYAHEIEVLEYPLSMYQISEPLRYHPPENVEPVIVDTEDAVHAMLEELRSATEIAIDLEHNDKNSYIGMVCLMQISTRDRDWIVDTLKPWRENLQVLNEVFADPKIIKVFHGSTSDIIWLQRDLGLYIVGLFDTYWASNALAFPQKSLRYLLQRFASFEAQKQFQLADWRVRPLPQELLDYARSDTHYLLYIFDNLRNMLLEASPDQERLNFVLENSKRESLQVYERPVYDHENGLGSGGWLRMLMSRSTGFSNEQFGVFRALHQWRDQKARELDEGEQNIMPNQYIFLYAENMPTRRAMFFQRGMSIGRLPARVAELIPEIIEVITQGRDTGQNGPSIYEAIEKNGDKVGFMFGRNKYSKKKPDDVNQGVGGTLQRLNQNDNASSTPPRGLNGQAATTPVVTKVSSSQLFGGIDLLPGLTTLDPTVIAQALGVVLPINLLQMPTRLESALTSNADPIQAPANSATHSTAQLTDRNSDIFTLKERSKKRKAVEESEMANDTNLSPAVAPTFNNDFESVEMSDEQSHLSKRQRKAERKARKAQQEAERKAAQENIVPFDYANAESVLNARVQTGENETNGSTTKPLNPFIRAMDTSTGARRNRAGKEMPGKSHTFTS